MVIIKVFCIAIYWYLKTFKGLNISKKQQCYNFIVDIYFVQRILIGKKGCFLYSSLRTQFENKYSKGRCVLKKIGVTFKKTANSNI